MTAPSPSPVADTILWDVIEEHLDEAEFLAEVWHTNLDSPAYLRDEFAAGPQERLLAHVDGLVVGGEPVRAQTLEATLGDEDCEPWRATAAALAMLGHPSSQVSAPLFAELDQRTDDVRAGIVAALSMSAREDIDVRITDALRKPGAPAHRVALATVGGRRCVTPGNLVDDLLKDGGDAERAAAVSMLPYGDRRYLGWVEHCVAKPDAALQWSAIRAGLVMGSGQAWQTVGKLGLTDAPHPDALVLLASLADANIVQRLVDQLPDAPDPASLVYALGYSGRRNAIEACLALLGDETLGPLAGEAFAAMTGLPLEDDVHWDDVEEADEDESEDDLDAELEEDDEDDDLEIQPESELRIPKPEAIAAWWSEHQARFGPKQRYVVGRPVDQVSIGHALRVLPMRRHHALAFELLVRSKGQIRLRTRSLTSVGDPVLAALAGLPRVDGNRSYGQH
jgi:uncharacterized protein (TIGR02270 family)